MIIWLKLWPYLAGLLLAVGITFGIYHKGVVATDAKWQAKWDAREAALVRERAALKDERQTAITRVSDEGIHQIVQLQADAAAAANAADSLRDAAIAAADRECGKRHPPVAGSSAPAAEQPPVLADMLAELEARGRAMAEEADRRGIAGTACEQAYDALKTSTISR